MYPPKLITGVLVWLFSAHALAACPANKPSLHAFRQQLGTEIKGPYLIADLERENAITIQETGKKVPFGLANAQWNALKRAKQPNDKIYFVSRSQNRFYIDGYALVRSDCIVYFLTSAIS